MIKTKVAFLEGRILTSQSEQFKKYSKSSDWMEKSHFSFDHVNRLTIHLICFSRKRWIDNDFISPVMT